MRGRRAAPILAAAVFAACGLTPGDPCADSPCSPLVDRLPNGACFLPAFECGAGDVMLACCGGRWEAAAPSFARCDGESVVLTSTSFVLCGQRFELRSEG